MTMGGLSNSIKRRGRGLAALGVVVGAGLAFMAPVTSAGASSGGKLYVNATSGQDTGTCRLSSHPCQTIAYALTQATEDSTIEVASGSYPQQLVINTDVTIAGPTSGKRAVVNPTSLPASDTDTDSPQSQFAIVDVTPGVTAKLKNLTINGANASGQFTDCSVDYVGVYYHDASGTMSNDTIENVVLPQDEFGCQDGLGVYVASDSGQTSNVTMTTDTVTNYDKNGITCDDAGTTCSITGSTVSGIGPTSLIAQNGIQLADALGGTITDDQVTANSYTQSDTEASGLLVFGVGTLSVTGNTLSANDLNAYLAADTTGPAEENWTISGNTVTDGSDNVPGGAGFGDGIDLDSTSNPVTIMDNTVTGGADNGISLFSTSNTVVNGNTTSNNKVDGIYVGGPGGTVSTASTGDMITGNTSNKNGGDGIHSDILSTGNTFTGNKLKKDLRFDIEDAGSGNTWSANTCKPMGDSSPSGLCAP
jgi:parallel beta-helix repeat protein